MLTRERSREVQGHGSFEIAVEKLEHVYNTKYMYTVSRFWGIQTHVDCVFEWS